MKKFAKDIPHYMSLTGVILAATIGFFAFSYDRVFQMAIALGAAGAYVAWGVIHHILHRDFDLTVFAEYLAIATLGLIIIFSLLVRA